MVIVNIIICLFIFILFFILSFKSFHFMGNIWAAYIERKNKFGVSNYCFNKVNEL